ncbi:MAG: DUF971 domain-containing protein [Terracidiphilus sp.]
MSHEGIRIVDKGQAEREVEANRPLPRIAITPEKVRVLLTEGTGMEIQWQDGHRSSWSFPWLREACPCATCIEERKAEGRKPGQPRPKPAALLPIFTPPPKPASAQPVGRYAIQFNWQDGHSGGIYSWEYLRRQCQCPECTFDETAAEGTPN